jgi:hypothetical protein
MFFSGLVVVVLVLFLVTPWGALLRANGCPARYAMLHADDFSKYHSVVELFIDDRWVYFDPQFNLVL